jgi:hypothetical protein
LNHCAGGILGSGQEKGTARIGNTGKPFDEPVHSDSVWTQKTPALRVALRAGARGVAALDRIADTLFAQLLAVRLAGMQRSGFNLAPTCSTLASKLPITGIPG